MAIEVPMMFWCASGIGMPTVAWMSKSPQPLPPAIVGVTTQVLLLKAAEPTGAVTPKKAMLKASDLSQRLVVRSCLLLCRTCLRRSLALCPDRGGLRVHGRDGCLVESLARLQLALGVSIRRDEIPQLVVGKGVADRQAGGVQLSGDRGLHVGCHRLLLV